MDDRPDYLAITGDVIRSREMNETGFSQLKEQLLEFNRTVKPLVPFAIQAGDEIQGLMEMGSKPVLALLRFLSTVHPLRIRWGIGKGRVDSELLPSTSEMHGTAFEYSREALILAKKNKGIFSYVSSENNVEQINLIFRLLSGYLEKWNQMAYRRCQLYSDSKTIYKVAESEGVSTEAINKHLNRTNIRLVLDTVYYLDRNIFDISTL